MLVIFVVVDYHPRWLAFLLWNRRASVFSKRLQSIGKRLRIAVALERWEDFAVVVQWEKAAELREVFL